MLKQKECYEERDKSKRNFQGGGIRIMDVVADADGNPDQDIRCFPTFEDKQEEGMEIQYDLVISFQFHHVQMDGGEAARFMELLQAIIRFLQ